MQDIPPKDEKGVNPWDDQRLNGMPNSGHPQPIHRLMQLFRLQVAIDLRHRDAGMTQELLNGIQGDPVLYEPRSKGVPEAMEVNLCTEACQFRMLLENLGYVPPGQLSASKMEHQFA